MHTKTMMIEMTGFSFLRITSHQDQFDLEVVGGRTLIKTHPLEVAAIIIDGQRRNFFTEETKTKVLEMAKNNPEITMGLVKKYPAFANVVAGWGYKKNEGDPTLQRIESLQKDSADRSPDKPIQFDPKDYWTESYDKTTPFQPVEVPAAPPIIITKVEGTRPVVYRWNGISVRQQGDEIHTSEYFLAAILELAGVDCKRQYKDMRINDGMLNFVYVGKTAIEVTQAFLTNEKFTFNIVDLHVKLGVIRKRAKNYY